LNSLVTTLSGKYRLISLLTIESCNRIMVSSSGFDRFYNYSIGAIIIIKMINLKSVKKGNNIYRN
jgi:hypothetical protein